MVLPLAIALAASLSGQIVVSYTFGTLESPTFDADYVAPGSEASAVAGGDGLSTFSIDHAHSTNNGLPEAPRL